MSEVNGCRWYNPCSWFSCCFDDETGAREPLTRDPLDRPINHTDAPKTPESQKRHVTTPGHTPTRDPIARGEAVTGNQTWE